MLIPGTDIPVVQELYAPLVPIESIRGYENNARTHSKDQIDQIIASIKNYGFLVPIEINDEGMILSGHARLEAAKALGLTHVPVMKHRHLGALKERGYLLAANKLALKAGWDSEKLGVEFLFLEQGGFDMFLTGFDQEEIFDFLNPEMETSGFSDGEESGESTEFQVTKTGDIWILGNHRLMCGDSTYVDSVKSLYRDVKCNLMVTDPPYGVEYDPSWREGVDLGKGKRATGKVRNDEIVDWSQAYSLFEGNVAYVWHAGKFTHVVAKNLEDCGFKMVNQIIWAKQHFVLSRGDYHWQHEPCWYAIRDGERHAWRGKRDQSTLWEISNNNSFGNPKPEETVGHGTQKPLDCMIRPIENNSRPKDHVYDPFGGSGTTLIACEKLNRHCLMMEIDEKYCDMIIRRWQKFTNKIAVLESTGEVFSG